MNPEDIEYLVELLQNSCITICEYGAGDAQLRLCFDRSSATGLALPFPAINDASPPRLDEPPVNEVRAPATGVFTRMHPAIGMTGGEAASYVFAGEVIGYLRVDDVVSPVMSCSEGKVHQLITDGTLVGFGDPIFSLGR